MFKSNLVLKKVRGEKNAYILAEKLTYDIKDGHLTVKQIVVPVGFKTDLTTFWVEGRYTDCAVLHDYLLSCGYDRKKANEIMLQAMQTVHTSKFTQFLIFTGLELYRVFLLMNRGGK